MRATTSFFASILLYSLFVMVTSNPVSAVSLNHVPRSREMIQVAAFDANGRLTGSIEGIVSPDLDVQRSAPGSKKVHFVTKLPKECSLELSKNGEHVQTYHGPQSKGATFEEDFEVLDLMCL